MEVLSNGAIPNANTNEEESVRVRAEAAVSASYAASAMDHMLHKPQHYLFW